MAEKFTFSETVGKVTVEFIDNCGVNPQTAANRFYFYSEVNNRIQGWSHISKPDMAGTYAAVKHGPRDPRYYIPEEVFNQPPTFATVSHATTCNGVNVYDTILARKYTNGGSIHNNGIEPRIPNENLTFANMDAIVIEMKIDTQASNIMTPAQLQTRFGGAATGIDHGEFTLWVVGLGANGLNGNPKEGERIRLNMAKYGDRWIRVTILTGGAGGTAKINQVMMQPILYGNNIDQGGDGATSFKEMAFAIKNYYLRLK